MFSRLRHTMTYANVVATLALFLSLGGAAYAGAKIGGADIKNHSISGVDIKDGSLGAAQLATGSVGSPEVIDNSLRLNDLNTSVKAAFKKTVYQTHVNYQLAQQSPPTIAASPSHTQVATLTVPNGNYLLTAVVHVEGPLTDNGNGSPPVEIECTMGATSASAANQVTAKEDFRGEYLDDHQLALTLATPVNFGQVVITCDRTQMPVVTEAQVLEVSLQALMLDTIS